MQPHIIGDGLLPLYLEVYHSVLQFRKRFREVDIFSRLSQQCLLVATVPLGRLVSSTIFEIIAPPFSIPTMKARSFSLTSFPLSIFQLWMSWWYTWLQMGSNAIARTKTCGTGILVINSDKLIEMPILIWCI